MAASSRRWLAVAAAVIVAIGPATAAVAHPGHGHHDVLVFTKTAGERRASIDADVVSAPDRE